MTSVEAIASARVSAGVNPFCEILLTADDVGEIIVIRDEPEVKDGNPAPQPRPRIQDYPTPDVVPVTDTPPKKPQFPWENPAKIKTPPKKPSPKWNIN